MGKTDAANNANANDDSDKQRLIPTPTNANGSSQGFDHVAVQGEAMERGGTARLLQFLCRLTVTVLLRFWMFCSSASLFLLLAFWFYGGLVTLALLHLAILGLLYNAQDLLLYYPEQPPQARLFVDSPATVGLHHENLTVRTQDGVRLNMFLIKQPPNLIATAPTFIYFHGNAGNIGHRLMNVQALCTYCRVNVLLVEYRGYGKSEGSPSEYGLYLDGQAALDYIISRSDINQQLLVVFGRSLGGAVAIRTCSLPYYAGHIACLVVENTFTCIPEIARSIFNFQVLQYLPDFCHKNKFPSKSLVPKISVPALFISGLQDNLVPPRMMLSLYESCGSRLKHLALFPSGTHNETWQLPGYYQTLNKFLNEVKRLKQGEHVSGEQVYTVQSSSS